MITVRFQTGVSVTYNNANWAIWMENGRTKLLTKQDGGVVAMVPSDAIVEFSMPGRFENPIEGKTAEAALRLLTNDANSLRRLPSYHIKKLKLMLSDFNAKTHQWKDAQ